MRTTIWVAESSSMSKLHAQLFSRYPVRKIHHTSDKHSRRNSSVIARLMSMLTSEAL
jgi:hypothetical protein